MKNPDEITEFLVRAESPQKLQVRLLVLKEFLDEDPKLRIRWRYLYAFLVKYIQPWSDEYKQIVEGEEGDKIDT